MTVYVDRLRRVPAGTSNWPWPHACHLYADIVEELHIFAKRIGMRRQWFQEHLLLPHYDLNAGARDRAIRAGAVATGRDHLVGMLRSQRKEKNNE